MDKLKALSIDWESQRVFSQIAEQINKPLEEIVRLHKYMLENADDLDPEAEHISSIILESSQQIEDLIEDILKKEENNRIEIVIHDKFKYPDLYVFDELTLNRGNQLLEQIENQEDTRVSKVDLEWLILFETTILDNIDFYGLSISWLAKQCVTSERQIFRKIEKYTGLTPTKYIRCLKLYKAKELLENYTYSTVNEVANAVGLKDPYYFSKVYKEEFGRKPKEYLG